MEWTYGSNMEETQLTHIVFSSSKRSSPSPMSSQTQTPHTIETFEIAGFAGDPTVTYTVKFMVSPSDGSDNRDLIPDLFVPVERQLGRLVIKFYVMTYAPGGHRPLSLDKDRVNDLVFDNIQRMYYPDTVRPDPSTDASSGEDTAFSVTTNSTLQSE
jgi:hypothetical protein